MLFVVFATTIKKTKCSFFLKIGLTLKNQFFNIRASLQGNAACRDVASHSSRGLGHRPFTAVTGVRTPYGTPFSLKRLAGIAQW